MASAEEKRMRELIAFDHGFGAMRSRPSHADWIETCLHNMTVGQITMAVCRALRGRDAFAAGSDAPVSE